MPHDVFYDHSFFGKQESFTSSQSVRYEFMKALMFHVMYGLTSANLLTAIEGVLRVP